MEEKKVRHWTPNGRPILFGKLQLILDCTPEELKRIQRGLKDPRERAILLLEIVERTQR